VRLAPRLVTHTFRLPGAIPLCGNLLRPTQTHHETLGQLLKRLGALVVGGQKLPAQVISIRFRHGLFAADRRHKQSTLLREML
jgi:hypothetical protein